MPQAKGVRVTLLVEDEAIERFARRVLTRLGFGPREVRSIPLPAARNAKLWVTRRYPDEVKAYRRESNHQRIGLLVGTDADEQTVAKRRQVLAECLDTARMAARGDDERIVLWIPKWHVETWILALCGHDVAEDQSYKRDPRPLDFRAAAERFAQESHRPRDQRAARTLPSLSLAYQETERLN